MLTGNQGANTMTKIAFIAAIALNFSISSGFGQINPDFVKILVPTVPSQDVAADLGGDPDISRMLASRKVR